MNFHRDIAMLAFQLSDSVRLPFRLALFSLDISQWGPACISFSHALVFSTVLLVLYNKNYVRPIYIKFYQRI